LCCSDSSWVSHLHVVRKHDGSWRPCGDYQTLILAQNQTPNPLPTMMDFTSRIAGVIFSKLDLHKDYLQIPMHPADILKTTITTLFDFLPLPFVLMNADHTFKYTMDQLRAHIEAAFDYLDDIMAFGKSPEEHEAHLHQVIPSILQHGW
jgi:hypothetical protein